MKIDLQTEEFYQELLQRQEGCGIAWPQVLARSMYQEIKRDGNLGSSIKFNTLKQYVYNYEGDYADWYRCVGYIIYGYGNLSNNDRIRKGERPLRFTRSVKRNMKSDRLIPYIE